MNANLIVNIEELKNIVKDLNNNKDTVDKLFDEREKAYHMTMN